MTESSPRTEYGSRRDRHSIETNRFRKREGHIANARLFIFLSGIGAAIGGYMGAISYAWLLLPAGAFVILIVVHDRVIRAINRGERLTALYERGIDRIDGRWHGVGADGGAYLDENHVYARDLDILGPGSVFQWMNTARSTIGEKTLADWLCAPANLDTVRDRQAAVSELAPQLDLREALALIGSDVGSQVDPNVLSAWGEHEEMLRIGRWWIPAGALVVLGAIGLAIWIQTGFFAPFVIVFVIDILFLGAFKKRVEEVERMAGEPRRELGVLTGVLGIIEHASFTSPLLNTIQNDLSDDGVRASACVRQLDRRIYLLEAPRNAIFAPVAIALMWPLFAAAAVERWRMTHGASLRRWCDCAGEFEALCAIANCHYENPDMPMPTLDDNETVFDGEGIAHPLLPLAEAVRNDLLLSQSRPLIMVSGSNMSGKSTLLRAAGVNTVLAMAGAPVRAESLRTSRLQPGANMRVNDSVQEGKSRFYAEILRLKQLQDLADADVPLLFLLDELLHGTNSHDRCIGAAGVIHRLIGAGAVGLVTSHDLAMTSIADDLGARADNMHFQDSMTNGELSFDYTLRPGVVAKSNALELMKSAGLDVETGEG